MARKEIKCLGINLTMEVKDLYSENYKTLMKVTDDERSNRMISCVNRLEESIKLKWAYHPQQSTDLMQFLSKYTWYIFTKPERITILFTWRHKRSQIAKAIFRKQNQEGGIISPNFRLDCKATANKTVWNLYKNRHIGHRNWIEHSK